MNTAMRWLAVVSLVAACGSSSSNPPVPPDLTVEQPGVYAVGTTRFTVTDTSRDRMLVVQAWYPTAAAVTDTPIEMLEIDPQRTTYAGLLATAPAACPSHTLPIALDAPALAGSYPLVLISHCHSCTRLSNASTAIRLASHGFAVASVEHLGDTLWNHLAGTDANIDGPELQTRGADVSAVLDQIAAGATPLGAIADLAHVGVLGHSMGAVTAGLVAQDDSRIAAAAALCAPVDNPVTPGVTLADVHVPLLFVVAVEDNSISEFGNLLIRNNFRDTIEPATKVEISDAGHWSVSDLDGLVDIFAPGCGDAKRQTDGTAFTYLDPTVGRDVAASYATAFFAATLEADAGAKAYLKTASQTLGATLDVAYHAW